MSELTDMRDKHYEGVTSGDLDKAASMMADDVENILPGAPPGAANGLEAFRAFAKPFASGFPDSAMENMTTIEAGDTIITEGLFTGTNTGPLETPMGTLPATGKKISLPFADIFVARDHKFVKHHLYFDQAAFMAQLGLVPEPAKN
jgi:predicted ester cyclase